MNTRVLTTKGEFNILTKFFTKNLPLEFPEYKDRTEQILTDDTLWSKKTWKQYYKNAIILGAWEDKELVGFVAGAIPQHGVSLLSWLIVDQKHQNQGIGKELLRLYEEFVGWSGGHFVYTYTHERIEEFYQKQSYTRVGPFAPAWLGLSYIIYSKYLLTKN